MLAAWAEQIQENMMFKALGILFELPGVAGARVISPNIQLSRTFGNWYLIVQLFRDNGRTLVIWDEVQVGSNIESEQKPHKLIRISLYSYIVPVPKSNN